MLSAERVAVLAQQGDAVALAAFDQLGSWLGTALGSLISTLNIETVIIGGGVSESFELLLPAVRRTIQQRCFPQLYAGLVIEKGPPGR